MHGNCHRANANTLTEGVRIMTINPKEQRAFDE